MGEYTRYLLKNIEGQTSQIDYVDVWPLQMSFKSFKERLIYQLKVLSFEAVLGVKNLDQLTHRHIYDVARRNGFDPLTMRFIERWMGNRGERTDPSLDSDNAETRNNMYMLCSALGLDVAGTTELFEKVLFSRAFNVKHRNELVFLFFASREEYQPSWYLVAQEVNKQLDNTTCGEIRDVFLEDTEEIEISLDEVLDVADLIKYIQELTAGGTFEEKNWSIGGRECVQSLYDRCRKQAIIELSCMGNQIQDLRIRFKQADFFQERFEQMHRQNTRETEGVSQEAKRPVSNALDMANTLLSVICGANFNHKETTPMAALKTGILPATVKKSFPTTRTLSSIRASDWDRSNAVSLATIRKTIILLSFYCFFMEKMYDEDGVFNKKWVIRDNETKSRNYKEYVAFVNRLLVVQARSNGLYAGDEYDALFMYCAGQGNPLEVFRKIIRSAVEEDRVENETLKTHIDNGLQICTTIPELIIYLESKGYQIKESTRKVRDAQEYRKTYAAKRPHWDRYVNFAFFEFNLGRDKVCCTEEYMLARLKGADVEKG